ncbi:TetR/AcrR family transcriptional regulator [Sphaerisporangium corydalis]|uniref:TetR/AcrR family transcriptional regulator n=1 Tax=Sphaerisporangium corydalis TaxID=1441875 RepID=A0ABV9EG56_9ACTN|nr:TetR/AcrR family transcriptional regulator [Sphaerisporangium corydalis]
MTPTRDGRKRTFVEEARRRQILACAVDLIAEHGYANATLARIAERAHISKAAVLYHFDNKEEILRQVLTETLDELTAQLAEALSAAASPPDAIAAYVHTLIAYMAGHPAGVRILVEGLASTELVTGTNMRTQPERWRIVADIFARGQQSGSFRDFDTHTAAICLNGAIDAIASEMLANPDYAPLPAAESLVDFTHRATLATGY